MPTLSPALREKSQPHVQGWRTRRADFIAARDEFNAQLRADLDAMRPLVLTRRVDPEPRRSWFEALMAYDAILVCVFAVAMAVIVCAAADGFFDRRPTDRYVGVIDGRSYPSNVLERASK